MKGASPQPAGRLTLYGILGGVIHVNLLFLGTRIHLEQVGFIMFTKVIYDCFLVIRVFDEADVAHL